MPEKFEPYPQNEPKSHGDDAESSLTPELLINGHEIGIATATYYPDWYPGPVVGEPTNDKVRGDLALETVAAAQLNGYQTVVIDGGSAEAFITAVRDLGIAAQPQEEKGMSASRREGLATAADLDGAKVLCYIDAEKVSAVEDCMADAVLPILEGKADIVIPRRDNQAFATYPDYQAEYERQSNHLFNDILRRHGLMPAEAPDLDVWFGPRFLRNDPDILELFQGKYRYLSERQSGLGQDTPETWPNGLFLPIVAALHNGYRVVGADVPYHHPASQTAFESDSEAYRQKRAMQQEIILKATVHFVRYLEDTPGARIGGF